MALSTEEHHERLGRFVVRVRRVLASPLAQDDEQLRKAHAVHVGGTADGQTLVSDWLPDETALESLAARLRPLVLSDDLVHYGNGLASLGALLRGEGRKATTDKANVKALRKAWDGVTNEARGRYVIFSFGPLEDQADVDGVEPQRWRDREAAAGWFYGDLVHADRARQDELHGLSLEERVHAAFGFVADVVQLCWRTLGLIWVSRRDLALPAWAWDRPVGIEPGWRMREGEAYVAAPGTPLSATPQLSDQWERFTPGSPAFEDAARAGRRTPGCDRSGADNGHR